MIGSCRARRVGAGFVRQAGSQVKQVILNLLQMLINFRISAIAAKDSETTIELVNVSNCLNPRRGFGNTDPTD